jgi:hydrogenase expression/formation protein HypC
MCLALPGLLETIDDPDPLTRRGRVRFGGIARTVHLALVPDAVPGDHVLVHVGVALAVVDPEEVRRLDALLDSLDHSPEHAADGSAESAMGVDDPENRILPPRLEATP